MFFFELFSFFLNFLSNFIQTGYYSIALNRQLEQLRLCLDTSDLNVFEQMMDEHLNFKAFQYCVSRILTSAEKKHLLDGPWVARGSKRLAPHVFCLFAQPRWNHFFRCWISLAKSISRHEQSNLATAAWNNFSDPSESLQYEPKNFCYRFLMVL